MDLRGVFGEGFALPLFVVVSFLTGLDASGVTSLFRFVGGGGGGADRRDDGTRRFRGGDERYIMA